VNVIGLRGEANMQLRLVDVVMTSVLAIVERPGFSQGLSLGRTALCAGSRSISFQRKAAQQRLGLRELSRRGAERGEARRWCRRWSSEARLRGLSRRLGAPAR
jgi:hypothetical protein